MRKTYVLIVFAMLFAVTAMAQDTPISPGSMMVGGSAYFQSLSGDLYENEAGDSYTEIMVAPNFGYFVAPGLVIGGELAFSSMKQGDYDASAIGIGPMIGFYFNVNSARTEVKGSIYPYIKGQFIFLSASFNDSDATQLSLGGGAGINYMISDAVAIDLGLQIFSDSYEPDGGDSISGMNMMFGAGIQAFVF
ncbi:MAG: outer membrane beta-barrel protein [Candidatus Zixiibacteriota bacterium]